MHEKSRDKRPGDNFDSLRLLMALAVLLAHCAELSRSPALMWIPTSASTVAVQGFFAISGYLMIGSFERSRSVADFFRRRLRRIYPAYAASVVALSALLVCTSATAVLGADWLRYLAANLVFMNWLHGGVSGLFAANPLPVLNGALWSMKFEICCYAGVPIVFLVARRLGWIAAVGAVYVGTAVIQSITHNFLAHQVMTLVATFAAGSAIYRWRDRFDRHRYWLLAGAAIALLTRAAFLEPAALAILILAAARAPQMFRVTRFGDLSYGMYVTHFPLIQALVAVGAFAAHPASAVALTLAGSALLAMVLWRFVEQPFIAPARPVARSSSVEPTPS